jgi:hypothetical protein
MAGNKKVNINYIVKSVHSKSISSPNLRAFAQPIDCHVLTLIKAPRLIEEGSPCDDNIVLKHFILWIAGRHEIKGDITVHRSKQVGTTRDMIADKEISGLRFTLTENETIFVLYDEKVEVIHGGVGLGAEAYGPGGWAGGGHGRGGEIALDGTKTGGDGEGGNLIGRNAVGRGGDGVGAHVDGGTAGAGVGGDVLRRDLNCSTAGRKWY